MANHPITGKAIKFGHQFGLSGYVIKSKFSFGERSCTTKANPPSLARSTATHALEFLEANYGSFPQVFCRNVLLFLRHFLI